MQGYGLWFKLIFLFLIVSILIAVWSFPLFRTPSKSYCIKSLKLKLNPPISSELLSYFELEKEHELFGKNIQIQPKGWKIETDIGNIGILELNETSREEFLKRYESLKNNTLFDYVYPNIFYSNRSNEYVTLFYQFCFPKYYIQGMIYDKTKPAPISVLRDYNCTLGGDLETVSLDVPEPFVLTKTAMDVLNESIYPYEYFTVKILPSIFWIAFSDRSGTKGLKEVGLKETKTDFQSFVSRLNKTIAKATEKTRFKNGYFIVETASIDKNYQTTRALWFDEQTNISFEIYSKGISAVFTYEKMEIISNYLEKC